MTLTKHYRSLRLNMRRALAPLRMTPSFLILGTMRGGTTSLYHYLTEHPQVMAAFQKEIHFFTNHYGDGWDWYQAHFPIQVSAEARRSGCITGEGSPYYLYHPDAPRRVKQWLPRVKLLALLRHPVDRAYSHYTFQKLRGRETCSFEEALQWEPERLRGLAERLLADESFVSAEHRNYSYRDRGIYADHLQRWFEHFPREQFLILNSEEFYARPVEAMERVFAFLGVQPWTAGEYKPYNARPSRGMDPGTRSRLLDYYAPHNERLYALLGERYSWDM